MNWLCATNKCVYPNNVNGFGLQNTLQKTKVNVMDWAAQRPDLNPVENLWGELKTKVHVRRPSNLEELERFTKEEWAGIPQETSLRLVEDYNKRLQAVIQKKGYTVYYEHQGG